ncbi:PLP-dependent cysteine synthase family protein [Lysinibacter cavernae]|uniref:L-cysteine desulfhydrase Cds1 n=1 Tax=Lysinibacter cavernae TaxID=1640652 RepID=A0A7X5TVF1_9MICO|nr:PLP-dependent cysteine synthase family protein [Lysinibacter cavernae]NIH54937.1 cysteine synthase A [Lysinibacter cavernae]
MSVDHITWAGEALRALDVEANRSADTHMRLFPLPAEWGIDLYVKDESGHPTGSLKHRLARSLFVHAIANGNLGPNSTVVESSSGSTAVSEAYFAKLLGLRFVAVIPEGTSPEKMRLIEQFGGVCHPVSAPTTIWEEALRLGAQADWHYMDQFANASVVTDWRGSDNIGASIFDQLSRERYPEPTWIVVGAGTGGTSATISRHCRFRNSQTRVAVVDPEGSVFYQAWAEGRNDLVSGGSRIEGIGRPRVEKSFVPTLIQHMVRVPDAGSFAAMRLLHEITGLRAGGSTGTNLYGALQIISQMREAGERGSVVILMCDGGERYLDTHYSPAWLLARGIAPEPHHAMLRGLLTTGVWVDVSDAAVDARV